MSCITTKGKGALRTGLQLVQFKGLVIAERDPSIVNRASETVQSQFHFWITAVPRTGTSNTSSFSTGTPPTLMRLVQSNLGHPSPLLARNRLAQRARPDTPTDLLA